MKGVSPLISTVILILIIVSAIFVVVNVAKPTLDRAYESAMINEAEQNMLLLDDSIREVASEGVGSLRSVVLKVSGGEYRLMNASENFTGAIQFIIDLKHSSFTAPMLKKIGNLKHTVGMNAVGLVGCWNFNERNGTVAEDCSNYRNHGILHNGSVVCGNPPSIESGCPAWVDGKFGGALIFDGIDDYVDCGNLTSVSLGQKLTIEFWYYRNDVPTTTYESPFSIDADSWSGPTGGLLFWGNLSVKMRNHADNSETDIGFGTLDNNKWHHIVFVWNKPIGKTYVNGNFKDQVVWDHDIGWDGFHTYIGKSWANAEFNGAIDEVRIYNRVLSEEEIKENYNAKASNYRVVLENNKIILTGSFRFGKGTHKLCIEKIGELDKDNKPLLSITAC